MHVETLLRRAARPVRRGDPGVGVAAVVAARCFRPLPAAVRALRDHVLDAEIILAVGRCPSAQRNLGAEECQGDVVAFLDEDSCPARDWHERLREWYANPRVVGVCGPNLAPPDEHRLVARAVDVVFTSRFGLFGKQAKYRSANLSEAGDNRLILCNASFRRDFLFEVGGFRTDLYPNEENEFLERARRALRGRYLLYDPNLVVYRRRPGNLATHFRSVFGYGVGRVNQLLSAPTWTSVLNLIPSVFLVLGLVCLALVPVWWLFAAPYALYAAALLPASFYHAARLRSVRAVPLLWLAYPGTHAGYALGQLWALLRWRRHSQRVNRDESDVEVHVVKRAESPWPEAEPDASLVTDGPNGRNGSARRPRLQGATS